MKGLLIFFILNLSLKLVLADPCSWQKKFKSEIKKLTPHGQKAANKIVYDLYYILGAAVQPLFDQIMNDYSETINNISNSVDHETLIALRDNLGIGNSTVVTLYFINYCKSYLQTHAIIDSFTAENKQSAYEMFNYYVNKFLEVYPSVLAIHRLLDDALFRKITKIERPGNLYSLAMAFNYIEFY